MTNKKVLFLIVILLVAGVVLVVFFLRTKQQQVHNEQRVQEIRTKIPDYFEDTSAQGTLVRKDSIETGKLRIDEGQELGDGVTYVTQKDMTAAYRQVFDEMQNNGWVPILGSFAEGETYYLKLRKLDEYLYIILEPLNNGSTRVTMLPIQKK